MRRRRAACLLAAVALASCASGPLPTASPSATPRPAAAAAPSPTATPVVYADTLRIGGVDWGYLGQEMDVFRQASGGPQGDFLPPNVIGLGSLVHSALYRYDSSFAPVPDLAAARCQPPGADGNVLRCHLVEATFSDGTPLTADDVAYTYRLFQRATIYGATPAIGPLTGKLEEVRVVDPRTVDLVLSAVDPTFTNDVLPGIPILSQHAVEAAYAAFQQRTDGLTAAALTTAADGFERDLGATPPRCDADAAGRLAAQLGAHIYREDFSRGKGAFQPCDYVTFAVDFIRRGAVALSSKGLDAVAAAFMLLDTDWSPVGAGPYRVASENANRVHLEARPDYHGGPVATRYVDLVPTNEDGSDLTKGTVDVFQIIQPSSAYRAVAQAHGVQLVNVNGPGLFGIQFNVRPGRMFADVSLRKALQLCVDLPTDVDAAAGGNYEPAYGPLIQGSWADDPSLPRPHQDVAAGKASIEASGWTLGPDGVYAKSGVRLAGEIVARSDLDAVRVQVANLMADDARKCGMDLTVRPETGAALASMWSYPHKIPGTKTPFDLYIGFWSASVDPDDTLSLFASWNASDAKHPDNPNFGGFVDPAYDALLKAGLATYDQPTRAEVYRQAQQELAAQLPYLYVWANGAPDAIRDAVRTTTGPVDFSQPDWAWAPETLVVLASGQ